LTVFAPLQILAATGTIFNSRVVVHQSEIATVDMGHLIERHNQLAMRLALGMN
jgi:hypothetical protein